MLKLNLSVIIIAAMSVLFVDITSSQVVTSNSDGDVYGKCSTYTECNNPHGTCYGPGAPLSECLLVCTITRHWVYCDGLGDGEGCTSTDPCEEGGE